MTLDKGIIILLQTKIYFTVKESAMSQIIACKNEKGIILASDSKAVDFDPQGKMVAYSIKRLYQLTQTTAIITGGAAQGAKMCESLKNFIVQERLEDIESVHNATLPFLASEYERFMKRVCEILPVDPINQVHFILAGYSARNTKNPFQLNLLWTKKKLPQIDGDEIITAYSVPRSITLEYQLNQLCKDNRNLEEIVPHIRDYLKKQSKNHQEIASPFSYVFITRDGFKAIQ